VIGAGIAGLAAARILADRVAEVTVVERDELPDGPDARKGVPQGRHPHALLTSGERILRDLFPGLIEDLVAGGAELVTGDHVHGWSYGGYRAATQGSPPLVCLSRPYLEFGVRRRVAALPNVTIQRGDILGLEISNDRVVGARVRHEDGDHTLPTDLVVNASGRSSQMTRWLEDLGHPIPPVMTVRADIAYSSRLYERTTRLYPAPSLIAVVGDPVENPRVAAAFPIEGQRWILAIMGVHGDRPPTDDAGFVAFAESLPKADVARLMRAEEPLGPAVTHRLPFSQWRRFDKVKRHPAGLVAIGDAICSFNPVYGQGMTAACQEALALGRSIDREGLASPALMSQYYKATAKILAIPWSMGAGGDFAYPKTTGDKPPLIDLLNTQTKKVLIAAQRDPDVADTFNSVSQLVAKPYALASPSMLLKIYRANRRAPAATDVDPITPATTVNA
jgi:2-polyprenyl-6-methoxyphenol hydroxylase-like FAD-dependent oxidoreductase